MKLFVQQVQEDEGDGIDDVANLLEELGLHDLERVDEGFGVDGEYESDEDVVITGYGAKLPSFSRRILPPLQPEDSTIVTAGGFYHRYSRRN